MPSGIRQEGKDMREEFYKCTFTGIATETDRWKWECDECGRECTMLTEEYDLPLGCPMDLIPSWRSHGCPWKRGKER